MTAGARSHSLPAQINTSARHAKHERKAAALTEWGRPSRLF